MPSKRRHVVSAPVGRNQDLNLTVLTNPTGANGETPAVCKEVAKAVGRKALRVGKSIMLDFIKSVSTIFLLTLAAFSWHSCQKDNVLATKSNSAQEQQSGEREGLNCAQIKNAVYESEGMLVFTDEQHFHDCIECLEQELEAYNDAYEGQYPTATAEQLDFWDSLNNFNEWQPLLDFEASKSFVSLRSTVEQQSQLWLNAQTGETINFDNDPDDICPILDEETRTLFNSDGYVRIGNLVVSKQDWVDEPDAPGSCCAWLRSTKHEFDHNDDPYLSNRKIVAKIHVRSGIIKSILKGKIKHYRKVGGTYKMRRADMRLFVKGIPFNGNCDELTYAWNAFKDYKKRKKRTVKAKLSSLWCEAFVCSQLETWPKKRSGLGFFVDNESHGYALYLKK